MMTLSFVHKHSLRGSRGYLCMALVLAGSLALPLLAKVAFSHKAAADITQRQLINSRRQAALESGAQAQLKRWQAVRAQWATLAERADALGWHGNLWSVRSIEVDKRRFSRREADTLINSLEPRHNRFMLPKSFSLKLTGNSGSLFIDSPAQDQPGSVLLSLSGDYYSRRVQ